MLNLCIYSGPGVYISPAFIWINTVPGIFAALMTVSGSLFQVSITNGKNEFMNALTLKKDVVLVLISVDVSF